MRLCYSRRYWSTWTPRPRLRATVVDAEVHEGARPAQHDGATQSQRALKIKGISTTRRTCYPLVTAECRL